MDCGMQTEMDMTDTTTARTCGNCGRGISPDDVVCPHCDALIAAYEAPAGAAYGSAAAVNPVDSYTEPLPDPDVLPAQDTPSETMPMGPAAPYVSPTAQSLESLDAQKPEAAATSTTFNLPESSPVSEALERTRATANLEAVVPTDAPEPVAPKAAVPPPDPGQQVLPADEESPAGGPSTAVERVRAQAEAGWFDGNHEEARRVAREATSASGERPRPEERASHREQPVRTERTEPTSQTLSSRLDTRAPGNERYRPRSAQETSRSPGIGSIVGFFIIVMLVIRILGSGSFSGFLILPVIVAGLIWLMAMIAKNTGRKTTSMPKDKRR